MPQRIDDELAMAYFKFTKAPFQIDFAIRK